MHYDDYYPFGAQMPDRSFMAGEEGEPTGKPRYTGHELDKETSGVNGDGLTGLYYAGQRYCDGGIARWDAVAAEVYRTETEFRKQEPLR